MLRTVLPLLPAASLSFFLSPLSAQMVQSVITTADLAHPMAVQPALHFSEKPQGTAASIPTLEVDSDQHFQTMEGFGASITDSAAYLIQQKLTPTQRDAVLHKLFSPVDGMGLDFLRQPIGSEDLSRHHFTFDSLSEGQKDPDLAHFAVPEEQAEVFATVKQALRLNSHITVMLTPWSPPAWMKTGGTMDGGELLAADEPVYGRYLTRAVQSFQAAGIPVKYLTVQNEPLNGTPRLASTFMSASQAARFIGNDLGPDLRAAGLKTTVLAYDHNWDHPEYPETILGDSKASLFVSGSALHCYGGRPEAQEAIHNAFPDKGIWLTECSGGTWDKEPALIKTARLLIGATRNWAKAVSLWGVALDQDHGPHDGGCATCRPLVTVDTSAATSTVAYTGDLYGLGHASRFVQPGAVHIQSTSFGPASLESVAFQNGGGGTVLLVLNNAEAPVSFVITSHGKSLQTSLPAQALATYTW